MYSTWSVWEERSVFCDSIICFNAFFTLSINTLARSWVIKYHTSLLLTVMQHFVTLFIKFRHNATCRQWQLIQWDNDCIPQSQVLKQHCRNNISIRKLQKLWHCFKTRSVHKDLILHDAAFCRLINKHTWCWWRTHGPCPVSERLANQKFSTWGFPINPNEAEIFFLLKRLANHSPTGHDYGLWQCNSRLSASDGNDADLTTEKQDSQTAIGKIWLLQDVKNIPLL